MNNKPLINAWSQFFIANSKNWSLYAITLTFKTSHDSKRIRDETRYLYQQNILTKIRKQLKRNHKTNHETIPCSEFWFQEFDEKNKSKANKFSPHHIHGILPIQQELTHKFWDFENNQVVKRLQKDIKSLRYVADFEIKPIDLDKIYSWVTYCVKGKDLTSI